MKKFRGLRMHHLGVFSSLLVTLQLTNALSLNLTSTTTEKGGRCPEPKMDTRLCSQQPDQCRSNDECSGESLCCSTGCNKICILPSYSGCEQARSSAERRARMLEPEGSEFSSSVTIPQCEPSGQFKDVQCDPSKGCYCVDSQGFEVAGTRAPTLEAVNCSNPNPKCEGPMCRMLCPHGFELDDDGCEICECRNVCKGVKCPGDLMCEAEQLPCTTDPCPPLPSCKQPRSLDSLCPFGAPLTIPDTGSPFLCGNSPGQPPCPAAFACNVQSGNDYGVCCASNHNFEKPGFCPVVAMTETVKQDDVDCPKSCRHDLDCLDFEKCCFTSACGKQCSKPANSTICLQQKRVAELLSAKELEGKGYIPQCDPEGNFVPKQCSRNGKVCWCVGPDGKNFAQSLGASESVNCTNFTGRQRDLSALRSDRLCDHTICSPDLSCEFGFKTDRNGCKSCDCVESPCNAFTCPTGSKCHLSKGDRKPICLSDSLFVNPCTGGTPLMNVESSQVVTCSEFAPMCPSTHICVVVAPNNRAGVCCPNGPRLEPTKPGICPFLSPSVCETGSPVTNNSIGGGTSHKKCGSDSACENSMKCCSAGDCTVCADPLLHQDIESREPKSSTLCQYLSQADGKLQGIFQAFKFAMTKPKCKETGEFESVQCDASHCFCVDEYGVEIPGTLGSKEGGNLTDTSCISSRHSGKCLEMNCRLACDYGYENLDGCRVCECRDPCLDKTICGEEESCEMVDVDCVEEHCPPLPLCVPKIFASSQEPHRSSRIPSSSCPRGLPFTTERNETLTCNPRARMLQCPDDFFCHETYHVDNEVGICCPIIDDDMESYLIAENRKDSDEVDLDFLLEKDPTRPGQCPYLLPFNNGSCDSECETDGHCPDGRKCCLNSCGGTQCIEPLFLTACQHQKQILEHQARESGTPSKMLYIPTCDKESGEYSRVQSFGKFQWCVDSAGQEIQGTRTSEPGLPNCQKPTQCPQRKCSLQCEFGLNLDTNGCPVCECKASPCDTDIKCTRGEECRMVQLNCISELCPPMPLCLPRLDNPCASGSPLSFEETGERVPCGNGYGNCPSSHKCNVSPFGEFAVCCPKQKEVCYEPKEEGHCKAVITKWFFNTSSNECEPFYYSGCGGNNNQFNSKAECLAICPAALSHCERIREKNLELVNKYHHMNYIPKCNLHNGEWESVQCFEEVGMCWCVDKKGHPVKGSMTNGVPNCQPRRGRMLSNGPSLENAMVCEPGVTVHKCNKSICEDKVCLGAPHANCRVVPCGGCTPRWVTDNGEEVDCSAGLSQCQREMQFVMNSPAWVNQGISSSSPLIDRPPPQDYPFADTTGGEVDYQNPFFGLGSALTQLLLRAKGAAMNQGGPLPSPKISRTSTKVTPIFANFGNGNKVMGMMSSTLTIMGGDAASSSEEAKPRSSVSNSNPPVKNIADILSDLMSSQSRVGHSRPGYLMDDLADLMPTSSHTNVQSVRGNSGNPLFPIFTSFPFLRDSSASSEGFSGLPRFVRAKRDVNSEDDHDYQDSLAMESSHSSEEIAVPMTKLAPPSNILLSILPRPQTSTTESCPPPSHFALLNLLSGSCVDECSQDAECSQGHKCCLSTCGFKCLAPQQDPSGLRISVVEMNKDEDEEDDASSSYHQHSFEPIRMAVSLPQCDLETSNYLPVQTQGELSWCVMPDGSPVLDSITRGRVRCSSNGTLIQRRPTGPVCADPDQVPQVCKDTCLTASCPRHPDAICTMDVCDGCKPSFYSLHGEEVHCEEKCFQPPGEPGFCRASILRYTFNTTSGKCEEFIYGGCMGNDNNFESHPECVAECEDADPDVCHLPVKSGPCRASMLRWFFNPSSQSCEQFDYGGCGGNQNNFMSREHCESRCPDLVICPLMSADGELSSCSRTTACKNATCESYSVDDFMCSVDPCTCTASLKDFQGHDVNCAELLANSTSNSGAGYLSGSHNKESAYTLDSDVLEAPQSQFTPPTGNQILKVLPTFTLSFWTRCGLLREQHGGQVSCDESGGFIPKQCPHHDKACFCVDETGKEIEGDHDKDTCDFVPISQVLVSLALPVGDDTSSVQLGIEMQDLLRLMGAVLVEEKVEVEVLPGKTNLNFALIGDTKINVSFWLEQLVIASSIGVQDEGGKFLPADFSSSKFQYKRTEEEGESSSRTEGTSSTSTESEVGAEIDDENRIQVDLPKVKEEAAEDTISAESLLNGDQNTTAVLLTVVAAITAVLVVFGMFLAFQKKTTGSYPKNPFESLAFSSQVYEIEKKVPLKDKITFATFKVRSPFANNNSEKAEKASKEKENTS